MCVTEAMLTSMGDMGSERGAKSDEVKSKHKATKLSDHERAGAGGDATEIR